jgi:DNA-binding LacI/PurR family transcriptional regulator
MSKAVIVKNATLTDVAKAAGVSRQVAGSVLNGARGNNSRASAATVQRINQIAEKLRYRPNMAAMHLRGRRTRMYGILVVSAGDPLRGMLVQELDLQAGDRDCQTLISNLVKRNNADSQRSALQCVEDFSRRGVDGLLCVVHPWMPIDRRAMLKMQPRTVFYEDPQVPGACYVSPDYGLAVARAIDYLHKKGRRRIGLATLSKSLATHKERVQSYRSELAARDIEFDPDLLFVAEEHGLHFDKSGSNTTLNMPDELPEVALAHLLDRGKADAIICHDDFMAAGFTRPLRLRGLVVGEDVDVMGYLNHTLCPFVDPPLTTFEPGYFTAAEHMVQMLEKMIDNDTIPENERCQRVEPIVHRRQSA